MFPFQKVKVRNGDPDGNHYVNGRSVDLNTPQWVSKKMPFVVSASKYGCRTSSTVVKPKRIDGLLILSAIFYPLFPFEFLMPGGPKRHAPNTEAASLETIPDGHFKDMYIGTSSTLNQFKLENIKSLYYKSYNRFLKSGHKPFAKDNAYIYSPANLNYSMTTEYELESKVDELLEIMHCKNDLGGLITNYEKFISLAARVKEGEVTYVRNGSLKKYDLKMEWYFKDRFNQTIDSMEVIASSEWMFAGYDAINGYTYAMAGDYSAMYTIMEDAIIKMIHNPEFEERLLNVKNKVEADYRNSQMLKLPRSLKKVESLKDAIQAQVTIVVGDYHGSGCVISADGHILTSYKLIQDADSIDVMLMNGSNHRAEVLRKDPMSNLALLKIDTIGLVALQPRGNQPLALGSEVFAFGTPADKLLSQTITRGVVSGSRLENEIHFIQTDARLSAGDNGCPLVTENGDLSGIVNEKIVDRGIDGLSFAVPISTAMQRLKIEFQ